MRKNTKQRILMIVCVACMALPPTSMARAIPPDPDNAALLYYQALLTIPELDGQARGRIADVAKGTVAPDDEVRESIEKCRGAIKFVEAAVDVPTCHWGVRFSEGFDAQMPQLAQMRFLAFILGADARIRAFDGNCRGALERCLLMDSVSRHIADDTIISYLVSIVVRQLSRECMQKVVCQAAGDAQLLRWLKTELMTSGPLAVSPLRPMKIEMEIALNALRMENAGQYARLVAGEDEAKQREILARVNEETFQRAREIYKDRATEALTVLSGSMPYDQAHSRLKRLVEDLDPNDPASAAAGALAPALAKILTIKVRGQAHANAIEAAIEICLRRIESGRLPQSLPAGLPKDPFSGADFEYERTDNGFVLRCRGKDLDKDTVHEYSFVVK